jgi:hypothetical protein
MKLLHGAIATVLFALSSPLWAAPKSVTSAVRDDLPNLPRHH